MVLCAPNRIHFCCSCCAAHHQHRIRCCRQASANNYLGLANNQLHQFNKAKTSLETGLDFVIDDLDLEINFNLQLAEAYNGLGDFKKKDSFFAKADQLIQKQKK